MLRLAVPLKKDPQKRANFHQRDTWIIRESKSSSLSLQYYARRLRLRCIFHLLTWLFFSSAHTDSSAFFLGKTERRRVLKTDFCRSLVPQKVRGFMLLSFKKFNESWFHNICNIELLIELWIDDQNKQKNIMKIFDSGWSF